MDVKIDASWKKVLQDEFEKPYFAQLTNFVRDEYKTKKIFLPEKRKSVGSNIGRSKKLK